jgi:hypothetical protein
MPAFPSNLKAWSYRKAFQITEQAGQNLTDYQKLIKIGESSGATGCDFHLEGLSSIFPSGKNQGGDLRITDSDKTTLLNFWVEQVTGTSPNRIAYVWVKIPSLSANQTKTLYCYFGNPAATNASNGDNTFILFDDFEGTTVDTNKWNVGYGTISVANSVLTVAYSGTTTAPIGIYTKNLTLNPTTQSFRIRSRNYVSSGNDWIASIMIINSNAPTTPNNYLMCQWTGSSPSKYLQKRISGVLTNIGYITSSFNTYVIDTLLVTNGGNSASSYQDTTLVGSGSYVNNLSHVVMIGKMDGSFSGYNYSLYEDWIFVSKYVSPEPAFSSVGSLEKRSSIIPLII